MVPDGYESYYTEAWENFPGASVEEDTARMNQFIESWVQQMPDQYFWLHKRFKTRPEGEPSVYGKHHR
jgi:KDO2-lipid IV(A) lauroyltransferase